MIKISATIGPMPRTKEWYQARTTHFGASEAAALCGLSPWRQPLDVYLQKTNPQPSEDNEAMQTGRHMEPAILSLYSEREECEVETPLPMLFHPDVPYIAASLDGRRDDGRPVEAKFSMSYGVLDQLGEDGTDAVPVDWLMQCQQQMDVVGADSADVAAFVMGKLRVFHIQRHDGLVEHIHQAAWDMQQRIAAKDPPPVNVEHARALQTLHDAYPAVVDNAVTLDADLAADARRYIDLGPEIKELQTERDHAKARILAAMGESSLARIPGYEKEFTRTTTPEKEISFTRKASVTLRARKVKVNKNER